MSRPEIPESPESIARSKVANLTERERVKDAMIDYNAMEVVRVLGFPINRVREEQWERVDAIEQLRAIRDKFGDERVRRWLDSFRVIDKVDTLTGGDAA